MNLLTTIAGSLMEGFLPKGWDLPKIDSLCALPPEAIREPQPWWNEEFQPVPCRTLEDFDTMMGHEIAMADQARSRPEAADRVHPARRPDGHVPLDRLLPQGMGRFV